MNLSPMGWKEYGAWRPRDLNLNISHTTANFLLYHYFIYTNDNLKPTYFTDLGGFVSILSMSDKEQDLRISCSPFLLQYLL